MTRVRDDVGSYDDIAAAAVRTTGLDDFGGRAHEEGLRLLVDDLASPEAGLTGDGNYFQRAQVKSALVGRLLTQAGLTAHPSYADVPIERPVFVVGLPRTGTTALHRLLRCRPPPPGAGAVAHRVPAAAAAARHLGDDPVFTAMQAAFAEHQVTNPEFLGIHYMDATSVEECWRVLRQTGKSIGFESLAHVPRYSAWLAGQDWTDAYERHRTTLQLVGLHDPGKRWVLKNPSHLVALDALMAVYPDALVVCTHRDPVDLRRLGVLAVRRGDGRPRRRRSSARPSAAPSSTMLSRSWHAFADARPRTTRPSSSTSSTTRSWPTRSARPAASTRPSTWAGRPRRPRPSRRSTRESRRGGRRPAHTYALDDYGLTEDEVRAAF